jgi:hypothetical protein
MSDPSFRIQPKHRRELRLEWIRQPERPRGSFSAWLRAGVAGAYLPPIRLDLPHIPQEQLAQAVPACAAMVLHAYGIPADPALLSQVLRTDEFHGTPGKRLKALKPYGIEAAFPDSLQRFRDGTVALNGTLDVAERAEGMQLVFRWEQRWLRYVTGALRAGNPPILFVDHGRLYPRWRGLAQPHAVVLAGGDGRQAWVHDPARFDGPTRIGIGTLLDALLPGEPLAAVIRPSAVLTGSAGHGEWNGQSDGESGQGACAELCDDDRLWGEAE